MEVINCGTVRTLFLVCQPIYPPGGGASLRNWQHINAAAKVGRVGVFRVGSGAGEVCHPDVIDRVEVTRMPSRDAAHNALKRKASSLWRRLHPYRCAKTDKYYSPTHADQLRDFLNDFRPDTVVFEEPWLYRYLSVVREVVCNVVFDAHNVEAPLRWNMRTSKSAPPGWRARLDLWSIRNIERSLAETADQVWTCSLQDTELMRSLYDPESVRVIPNTLDASTYASVRKRWDDGSIKPVLTFIGSFGYGPNQQAAHTLLEKIFPRVQKAYPESQLLLVGNSPSSYMQEQAEDDSSIVVTGFVDDVRPYLAETDIVAIPLVKGSGTRLKVIEAFASKLPVVSTQKGVEGLEVKHKESALIADTPERMVEQILTLASNSRLRRHLARNGYQLMKQSYSWEAVHSDVVDALERQHVSQH